VHATHYPHSEWAVSFGTMSTFTKFDFSILSLAFISRRYGQRNANPALCNTKSHNQCVLSPNTVSASPRTSSPPNRWCLPFCVVPQAAHMLAKILELKGRLAYLELYVSVNMHQPVYIALRFVVAILI
jgi:hypothetical protein